MEITPNEGLHDLCGKGQSRTKTFRASMGNSGKNPSHTPKFSCSYTMPTPTDNLPILAGIQPAELCHKMATLFLARCVIEPGIGSIQRSPAHRMGMRGISNRDILLCPPHNNSSVHLTTQTKVRRTGRIINAMWSGWRALRNSALSSPTSAPTLLEWPCHEQRGSGLTASAPVPDVSTTT